MGTQGEIAYQNRASNPDAYCEGAYSRPVSAGTAVRLEVLQFLLKDCRNLQQCAPDWYLIWPFLPQPVRICAQHNRSDVLYRLDAREATPTEPDVRAPPLELFRWNTKIIQRARAAAMLPDWDFLRARVQAEPGLANASGEPSIPSASEPVYAALLLSDRDPASMQPASRPVTVPPVVSMTLWIAVINGTDFFLHQASLKPVEGDHVGKVVPPRWLLETPTRPFRLEFPPDGRVWKLKVEYGKSADRAPDRVQEIYLRAPTADFAAWVATCTN